MGDRPPGSAGFQTARSGAGARACSAKDGSGSMSVPAGWKARASRRSTCLLVWMSGTPRPPRAGSPRFQEVDGPNLSFACNGVLVRSAASDPSPRGGIPADGSSRVTRWWRCAPVGDGTPRFRFGAVAGWAVSAAGVRGAPGSPPDPRARAARRGFLRPIRRRFRGGQNPPPERVNEFGPPFDPPSCAAFGPAPVAPFLAVRPKPERVVGAGAVAGAERPPHPVEDPAGEHRKGRLVEGHVDLVRRPSRKRAAPARRPVLPALQPVDREPRPLPGGRANFSWPVAD